MEQIDNVSSNAPRELPERFLVAFSYAREQQDLVRPVAEALKRLVGEGRVFLDEWFEHATAGRDGDLTLQEVYGEECDLVVVCVSEHYGRKAWTQTEFDSVRERMMKSRGSSDKRQRYAVMPIRVGGGDVPGFRRTAIIPDVRTRSSEEAAQLIFNRLKLIVPDVGKESSSLNPGLEWPQLPTPLDWDLADHGRVLDAFIDLMQREAQWRFLPICGASETGKSHITNKMFANAWGVQNLACGRFDFKGTSELDVELQSFAQDLKIPEPTANRKLSERLSEIFSSH